MPDYAPTSRRPIAGIFRRTADGATRFCVRHEIHPDAVSYLSILAAIVAAICFWKSGEIRWLLVVAPLFCYLRLWFNMLDGMVAVAAGKKRRGGGNFKEFSGRNFGGINFFGGGPNRVMDTIFCLLGASAAPLTSFVWPFLGWE